MNSSQVWHFAPRRTHGIIKQNFFSSPRLREWYEGHDARIDADLAAWEREEYRKRVRAHREYIAKKRAQAKKSRRTRKGVV